MLPCRSSRNDLVTRNVKRFNLINYNINHIMRDAEACGKLSYPPTGRATSLGMQHRLPSSRTNSLPCPSSSTFSQQYLMLTSKICLPIPTQQLGMHLTSPFARLSLNSQNNLRFPSIFTIFPVEFHHGSLQSSSTLVLGDFG